METVW